MWVFNTRHDFGVETDPTQGEFFVNNEIDRSSALVRETIQNSLDARRDDASAVEVRFSFHEGALFLGQTLLRDYTLHEELTAAGAQSLITTPLRLSPERRRKNDRLDARELCVRLSRYLDGHRHELRPIRIPRRAEVQRRELGRQREFWKRELRRLDNHGRALRIEHEHETLPSGWAGPRKWKTFSAQCSAFVRQQLEPVRQCRAEFLTPGVNEFDHGRRQCRHSPPESCCF